VGSAACEECALSETPVVPAPVDPTPSAEHRRLSLPQYFLFLLLAAAGILAMLVLANAAYGIAREHGADPVPWLALAAWALAPAACWTAAMFVLRAGLGQRAWSPWLVGLFVLVLTTLLAGGLSAVASSALDKERATSGAACSDSEIAVLTSVPGCSADLGEPTGQADGSCFVTLAV
jgi:fatty acid desaturase